MKNLKLEKNCNFKEKVSIPPIHDLCMREVKLKMKKDMWALVDRSTQHRPPSERSPSEQDGETVKELNYPCVTASAASRMTPPRPRPPIVILMFVGIIFGIVFSKYVFGYVNEIINQASQTSPPENAFEFELENVDCDLCNGPLCPPPTPRPPIVLLIYIGILFEIIFVNEINEIGLELENGNVNCEFNFLLLWGFM